MGRELYQLVAIDKNKNQYIIELNNENDKNKGNLEFIDKGTIRFVNEQQLAEYLYRKQKIPTTEVNFFIKYKHNGDKYIPVIYNDKNLQMFLSSNETKRYDYILNFFRLMEIEFSKQYFYDFFVSENKDNSNKTNNGNYLNNKLFFDLLSYYDVYIQSENYESSRVDLQYSILNELFNYKQFRTLYQFYKLYVQNFKENIESVVDDKPQINVDHNSNGLNDTLNGTNIFNEYYKNSSDISDEIRHAYETEGMDGVYGIVDLDDLDAKGLRIK